MRIRAGAWFLAFAVLAGTSRSEPQPWMVQDNPENLLAAFYVGESCPMNTEDVADVLAAAYEEAGLSSPSEASALVLQLSVQCGERVSLTTVTFSFTVDLTFFIPFNEDAIQVRLDSEPQGGGYGVGDSREILSMVKHELRSTLRDYVDANSIGKPE